MDQVAVELAGKRLFWCYAYWKWLKVNSIAAKTNMSRKKDEEKNSLQCRFTVERLLHALTHTQLIQTSHDLMDNDDWNWKMAFQLINTFDFCIECMYNVNIPP